MVRLDGLGFFFFIFFEIVLDFFGCVNVLAASES